MEVRMRLVPILCAVTVLTSAPAIVVAGQDHHGSKAATVMGFDQQRTAHHFFLFNDGGAIDERQGGWRHSESRGDPVASPAYRGDVRQR